MKNDSMYFLDMTTRKFEKGDYFFGLPKIKNVSEKHVDFGFSIRMFVLFE